LLFEIVEGFDDARPRRAKAASHRMQIDTEPFLPLCCARE
jgi:hypothetical protein